MSISEHTAKSPYSPPTNSLTVQQRVLIPSALGIIYCAAVAVGWYAEQREFVIGFPGFPLQAFTLFAVILAGGAVLSSAWVKLRLLGASLALLSLAFGLAALIWHPLEDPFAMRTAHWQRLASVQLQVDPLSACLAIGIAVASLCSVVRQRVLAWFSQLLAVALIAISLALLIRHADSLPYTARSLAPLGWYSALVAFSLGTLWFFPNNGWLAMLNSSRSTGRAIRSLAALVIIATISWSFLRVLLGEDRDNWIGSALWASGLLTILLAIAWLGARMDKAERARNIAEAMLRKMNRSLEKSLSARAEELFAEKELMQVTLHSIGDGVITTDASGQIDYLNPVAEYLTGWRLTDARGQKLDLVLQLIDETSRTPLENPAQQVLSTKKSMTLSGHTLLIARDGREWPVDKSASLIASREGAAIGVVIVFREVAAQRELTKSLSYQASHDALTGLVNRIEFERRLGIALESTRNDPAREHMLAYLDLDRFKAVNDSSGHAAGDELLRQVSALLHAYIRRQDTAARLGGDEFALLLENCPSEKALRLAELICNQLREFRFTWSEQEHSVGVSIGLIQLRAGNFGTVAAALQAADTACYAAKEQGRGRVYLLDVRLLPAAV